MKTDSTFTREIINLTNHHINNCKEYALIINTLFPDHKFNSIENLPYLPVRFFKEFDLKSVSDFEVFKIMLSSGTNGLQSKIYLDKENAKNQSKALISLGKTILGSERMPMFVIDKPSIIKNRNKFSARVAGINGFRIFSKELIFILNDNGEIDKNAILKFRESYRDNRFFIFGFTSIIWETLSKFKKDKILRGFDKAPILIHGGGWKKLENKNITNDDFKELIRRKISSSCMVKNYYGMIEQTGSIFFECSQGYFHETEYSRILIRNLNNFKIEPDGKVGLIQLISTIPTSYPGHSILTEDLGSIKTGNCLCGNTGKRFNVIGRAKTAEIRGCSDAVV